MPPAFATHVAAATLCALGAAACAPALDWREWRPEGGAGLVLQLPCKPASHARVILLAGKQVRTTLHACTAGGVTWAVAFADIQDPTRVTAALGELKASAAGNLTAGAPRALAGTVAGATPNPQSGRLALEGRYPDGRAAQMQLAVFARGTWLIQATALGERIDGDAADTFFAALRFPP